jgi:iron complex outermembrane recepter protein
MVLRPMRRLSMSVDYYHIKIANAIAGVGGNDATSLRICEDSGGTSPVCALYIRPHPFSDRSSDNYPTQILSQGLNIGSAVTKGIDGEINYAVPLSGNSGLDFRGLLSWQPTLKNTLFGTTINAAGAAGQQGVLGQAKWRATLFASYHSDHWGIDIQERWRASLKQSGNTALVFATPKVPSVAFTDLTLTAHPGGQPNRTVFFSVQNLFNKTAPVFISPSFASNPGFYYPAVNDDDVIGRYFTFGVRLGF